MKKTYITPKTMTVALTESKVLANSYSGNSFNSDDDYENQFITLTDEEETGAFGVKGFKFDW